MSEQPRRSHIRGGDLNVAGVYQDNVSMPFKPEIAKNLLHALEFSRREEQNYLDGL
jgi:hypothetical protein